MRKPARRSVGPVFLCWEGSALLREGKASPVQGEVARRAGRVVTPVPPAGAFQGSPWGELSPEATERGYLKEESTDGPLSDPVCALGHLSRRARLGRPSADGGDEVQHLKKPPPPFFCGEQRWWICQSARVPWRKVSEESEISTFLMTLWRFSSVSTLTSV